jgi:hypothetical protein
MKRFETDVFVMDVHDDGFVNFIVKKDAELESKDLWESRKMSLEYLPGKKFAVLMQAQDFFSIGTETRRTGASKEFCADLKAVALCSSNFALKMLGSLYIKMHKPNVQTRFFSELGEAEEWLKKTMKERE